MRRAGQFAGLAALLFGATYLSTFLPGGSFMALSAGAGAGIVAQTRQPPACSASGQCIVGLYIPYEIVDGGIVVLQGGVSALSGTVAAAAVNGATVSWSSYAQGPSLYNVVLDDTNGSGAKAFKVNGTLVAQLLAGTVEIDQLLDGGNASFAGTLNVVGAASIDGTTISTFSGNPYVQSTILYNETLWDTNGSGPLDIAVNGSSVARGTTSTFEVDKLLDGGSARFAGSVDIDGGASIDNGELICGAGEFIDGGLTVQGNILGDGGLQISAGGNVMSFGVNTPTASSVTNILYAPVGEFDGGLFVGPGAGAGASGAGIMFGVNGPATGSNEVIAELFDGITEFESFGSSPTAAAVVMSNGAFCMDRVDAGCFYEPGQNNTGVSDLYWAGTSFNTQAVDAGTLQANTSSQAGYFQGSGSSTINALTGQLWGLFSNTGLVVGGAPAGYIKFETDGGEIDTFKPILEVTLPSVANYGDGGFTCHVEHASGQINTETQYAAQIEFQCIPSAANKFRLSIRRNPLTDSLTGTASTIGWDGGVTTFSLQYTTMGW